MIINPNGNIEDQKHWCAANNFGIQPKHLLLSKIRCDFKIHVPCTIARKILYWFRSHIDSHYNNEVFHIFVEMLWRNA